MASRGAPDQTLSFVCADFPVAVLHGGNRLTPACGGGYYLGKSPEFRKFFQ